MPSAKPLIAITQGDPAGIGPEICLRALQDERVLECCQPVLIGDRSVLEQVSSKLGLPCTAWVVSAGEIFNEMGVEELLRRECDPTLRPSPAKGESLLKPPPHLRERLGAGGTEEHSSFDHASILIDCSVIHDPIEPGTATRLAGEASYRYITLAIEGVMHGLFDAVVTAPITKTTLHMAGIHEPGHTEIFARMTGTQDYAMMLYSPRIAVSFVTCHQPLRSVPDALTAENIQRVITLTGKTLRMIRGKEPKIAVLGLNPHAGEDGMFGNEDREIVAQAVERCREAGWDVEGPVPPDAAFMPHALQRYDGHVTLYHDQGSIPFKMISMHDGVNITMGLPIIRASVDHGTAYNIAWRGEASPSSLISAIELAARMSQRRLESSI